MSTLLLAAVTIGAGMPPSQASTAFLAKPYLQLGRDTGAGPSRSLTVMWHASIANANWNVEYRYGSNGWQKAAPSYRTVSVKALPAHRVYQAAMPGLPPGAPVEYRVLRNGQRVFGSSAIAPKGPAQPQRFVVMGDCARKTSGQAAVAHQVYEAKPDFVMITGDIVYEHGRASEYRANYFPYYNADQLSVTNGVPLARSTLFTAVPGNHDLAYGNLEARPDGQAYFYYWSQPLNGPALTPFGRNAAPASGPAAVRRAFQDAAGPNYPRMASFSFDYGNAHWTVLDSNSYINWDTPALRRWLEEDLKRAQSATWRFVSLHNPPFHSSQTHKEDMQVMRRVVDLFEKYDVDIVFGGHIHNYERTHPLRTVGGLKMDTAYDGKNDTSPDGVIYIVTGAGGAELYDKRFSLAKSNWQPFIAQFIAVHSYTLVEIAGRRLTLSQIDTKGKVLDQVRIRK